MNDSEIEILKDSINNLQNNVEKLQKNIKDLQDQIDFLRSRINENMPDPKPKQPSKRWLIVFLYTLPFIALICGYFLYFNSLDKNKTPKPKVSKDIIQNSLNSLNHVSFYIAPAKNKLRSKRDG